MLTRRELLANTATLAAPRRYNIIFILADDLGYGDLGCYGSETNLTPHLDRLAGDGLRLTDHYSCAPVCSPARAGLMTGLVPDRTGVTGVLRDQDDDTGMKLGLTTMAQALKAQGMRTAVIGKWHLGMSRPYWPTSRGFDSFWGFLSGTIDYNTHRSLGGGATGRRVTYENERPIEVEGYYQELATAKAVEFIEAHRAEPYFLYMPLALPHTPLQAPDRWVAPFRGKMEEKKAIYAGMVSCIDDAVGKMRAALERTGQWDRTVIVFTSDHGWVKKTTPAVAPAGSNGALRGGKYELYEGGLRVPCIVRWPGRTRPGSVSGAVSWFPDWFPTFTGKPSQDGVDLWSKTDRSLFWRFSDRAVKTPLSYAIRRGDWKLLQLGNDRMLFDLATDREERRNVLESNPSVVSRLDAELAAWKQSIGETNAVK